jgi:hypothetical protein
MQKYAPNAASADQAAHAIASRRPEGFLGPRSVRIIAANSRVAPHPVDRPNAIIPREGRDRQRPPGRRRRNALSSSQVEPGQHRPGKDFSSA